MHQHNRRPLNQKELANQRWYVVDHIVHDLFQQITNSTQLAETSNRLKGAPL